MRWYERPPTPPDRTPSNRERPEGNQYRVAVLQGNLQCLNDLGKTSITTTITSLFNETLCDLLVRKCFVTVIKLLAMDILAIATMKNAAKCDT